MHLARMGRAAQIFIIMHVVWWKVDAYALTIARANNAIMQYRRRGLNSGVGCAGGMCAYSLAITASGCRRLEDQLSGCRVCDV